jgi:hypothetical protein
VGWEWTAQGRAEEGTDVKRKNKMMSVNRAFGVVRRGARLRLCETDEGVRLHTSWFRHVSSVDIASA